MKKVFPPLRIRISQLLFAIKWLGWASHHAHTAHWKEPSPDGFAGRERVREIVGRYGIPGPIYVGTFLWSEITELFEANPGVHGHTLDVSGLLNSWAQHFAKPEECLGGLARFLNALATGELTETDFMEKSAV